MRFLVVPVFMAIAACGCAPTIPVRDSFGVTAAAPVADVPPEFAEFNNYNPAVNPLLADQMCATPYVPMDQTAAGAAPGRMVKADGRCASHIPLLGP